MDKPDSTDAKADQPESRRRGLLPKMGCMVFYRLRAPERRHASPAECMALVGDVTADEASDSVTCSLLLFPAFQPPRWVGNVREAIDDEQLPGTWRWPDYRDSPVPRDPESDD